MNKEHADVIVSNGAILTMNETNDVYSSCSLVVCGDRIVDVDSADIIASKYDATETLDASDHIVMPGLIDTHFHTAQQFERNLVSYLKKKTNLRAPLWQHALIPFEASLSDEDIHLSAMLSYANMLKVGTTCFAEAGGPKPELMAPALEEVGIRGILAGSTLDLEHNIPVEMQDTIFGVIEKGERLHKDWNGKADGRIRTWMAMRQIMICSPELTQAIKQTADQLNTGIHIHLSEQPSEVDFAIMKSGLRPALYLESLGFLGSNVHAGHSARLSQTELDLYQQYDVSVAHCPAIAFAACGPTKIPEMQSRGLRIGLGTDGALSSGGSLDLFRQMAITRYAQTALFGLPYREGLDFIDDVELLRMATIGGAKALHWDDEIGSLEVGKKADLVLIGLDELDVTPMYEPINMASSVVHGSNIKTVLVNGKIVMRDRKLTMIDEKKLKAKVEERAPVILKRFLDRVGSLS